jgi:hypothetical protein
MSKLRSVLAFMFIAGCGSPVSHTIVSADYSHACVTVSDCMPVVVGLISCCPQCSNDAIAAKDVPRYESDLAARLPDCRAADCAPLPSNCAGRIACTESVCTFGLAPNAATRD